MPLRPLNWFSDGSLALLLTLIRYAWLWPWFEVVRRFLAPQYTEALLAPWQFILVPLAAFGLTRFATREAGGASSGKVEQEPAIPWDARLVVAIVGLLVLIAVLWWQLYAGEIAWWNPAWLYALGDSLIHWDLNQGIPAPAVAIIVLISLWFNGLGDAAKPMAHDDVWGALLTGIIALSLYVALLTAVGSTLPVYLFQQILLLFTAGMVALAFSSLKITLGLDRALGLGQRRTSATPALNRYWFISVTTTVLVLLGLGLSIATLIAPEQMEQVLAIGRLVFNAVGRVIGAILLAVGYVLFLVAYFFARLLQPLIQRLLDRLQESPLMDLAQMPEEQQAVEEVMRDPTVVPDSYRWLALAIFAVIVLILFALAVRRLRAAQASEIDEVRESILTADLLQEQLSSLWQRWFGRRAQAADPYLSLTGEEETRRRIRAAYQRLLATATSLGQARRPGTTPVEYQGELKLPVAAVSPRLATLTAAYQQARYSADPPSAATAAAAQRAWQQIEAEMTAQESASPLDRTGHNTADQLLLEEEKDQQQR